MSNHKTYITIKTTERDSVNWETENVIEKKDTLRFSLDGAEFIIKWNVAFDTPPSVVAIPSDDKSAILTHQQARDLMATPEWTDPNPPE